MTFRTTAAVLALLLALPGCAAMRRSEAQSAEALLVEAGFKVQVADAPDETAKLQGMKPALRVVPRKMNGEVVYTYADPYNCMCVYVGTPDNYAEYVELAREKQIEQERIEIAQDEAEASMNMGWWWW